MAADKGKKKKHDPRAHDVTPGGSQVIRHRERTIPEDVVHGDPGLIEAVSDHFEEHIGPIHLVWDEIVSDLIHVDVHLIKPSHRFPFNTLFTTGMAEAPMTVPEGVDFRFAEMVTALPPDWPLSQEAFKDEANYWPVRWLKNCARLPHDFDTWFGVGHTIPNGDPPQPVAPGTDICGVMAVPAFMFDEDTDRVEHAGHEIKLLYMLPLTDAEMTFKLEKGFDALAEKLDKLGLDFPDMAKAGRPDAVAGKGRKKLWPFK